MDGRDSSNHRKRFVVAAAVLLTLILTPFWLFGDWIEAWTKGLIAGRATPALLLLLMVLLALDPVLPVPSSLVGIALGTLAGFEFGTLLGTLAMTAGVLFGLWLGRKAGFPLAVRMLRPRDHQRLARWMERYGAIVLGLTRAVPVLAEAAVLTAGAARVRLSAGSIATILISNLLISAAYAAAGAALIETPAILVVILAGQGLLLLAWRVLVHRDEGHAA